MIELNITCSDEASWPQTFETVASFISLIISIAAVYVTWRNASVFQRRLAGERSLKDFFISEVTDIQKQYEQLYEDISAGKIDGKGILSRLKRINSVCYPVVGKISETYKISSKGTVLLYINDVSREIEESNSFTECFPTKKIKTDIALQNILDTLIKRNFDLFVDLIVQINGAKQKRPKDSRCRPLRALIFKLKCAIYIATKRHGRRKTRDQDTHPAQHTD